MVKICFILSVFFLFIPILEAHECKVVTSNKRINLSIAEYLKQENDTESVLVRAIINNGDLFLVEYESKDFEPVIQLIMRDKINFKTLDQWGGAVIESQEGTTKSVVLKYFKTNHPKVNIDGLSCYDPVGPPFRHVKVPRSGE